MLKLKEITCKNALVKSRISGVDYCLNPYTGCEHNCAYCYAIFMKRFTDHSEEWGSFVLFCQVLDLTGIKKLVSGVAPDTTVKN